MPIDLILFGNMCSGKTTVGRILAHEQSYTVVSAMDVIRRNADAAGGEVRKLRAEGRLLPDDLVTAWIFAALDAALAAGRPVILDGYPRTAPQARVLLETYRNAGRVVHLDYPLDILRRRFENRVLCATCGLPSSRIFADFGSTCAHCGGRELHPRLTDRPDYFRVKTGEFASVSLPVLPLLRAAGLPLLGLRDHTRFADLRAAVLALAT